MLKFLCHIIRISIHAPTRGATKAKCSFKRPRTFQSTLLQEERQFKTSPFSRHHDFNPRSYKRSDSLSQSFSATLPISIHAPTRGATISLDVAFSHISISIHAPTRGATISLDVAFSHISISIHAPTRGATNLHINCECRIKFQSTLLQEERRFNCVVNNKMKIISIHAPTRGATSPLKNNMAILAIFQSTLLQEERHCFFGFCLGFLRISIHAPTRGATAFKNSSISICLFQSTLLQEERQCNHRTECHFDQQFQSTLLQEERPLVECP